MNSIYANLAVEEAIIAKEDIVPHLFLWRNSPTVTIGRHQNPWKECNLNVMDDRGVSLARRYSGGGAVYQDMGCTTFTFVNKISNTDVPSRIIDSNFEMLVGSLSALGLPASRRGRNDLVIGELKVSGSAFKQIPGRLVHHGTILVNTDMSQLASFLTPSKLKLQSKGISSVQARVSNLVDLDPRVNHDSVCDSLTGAYRARYGCPVRREAEIVDEEIQSDPVFAQHHSLLKDWHWRYGTTPEFSNLLETRIDGIGCFDCHYQVNEGRISKVKIFSDLLIPDLIDELQQALVDVEYRPLAVQESLARLGGDDQRRKIVQSFTAWFINEIK